LLNYTRIENADKLRKKIFVFNYVALSLYTITGGRTDRDAGAAVGQGVRKRVEGNGNL